MVVRKSHRVARKSFDIKVSPHGYRNRYISDWGYATASGSTCAAQE